MNDKRAETTVERPLLNPLPSRVAEIDKHSLSLNGDNWKLNLTPIDEFWKESEESQYWQSVSIPHDVQTGLQEYAYKTNICCPKEWQGNKVFLRFDGVNCKARVFVDGNFVREHYGGFVSWDCDITDYVTVGCMHQLTIGVMNKPQEVANFHQGGIIRDVQLYVLPQTRVSRFHIHTVFDEDYKNAVLKIDSRVDGGDGVIEFILKSPKAQEQVLGQVTLQDGIDIITEFDIEEPQKWDSEHPWLYTLTAILKKNGKEIEAVEKKIGFRQIEKRGNQIFLNGQVLKLRGINRHDTHPITGRSITHELVEQDVRLFKEANINFIRTSHYPPRPDFLDLCDQYGIYVEDEIAVTFVGYSINLTQDDPAYRDCFVKQFAEMIERDRSHPCVVIWSLANESRWGENHKAMLDYVKKEDPQRLTIFSYPITQQEEDQTTDLWSVHYANWNSKLDDMTECFRRSMYDGSPMPVIHDESIHIPHMDYRTMKKDAGIRDFWGETIKRFWENIWDTKGACGCAVWAGIDNTRIREGMETGPVWGIVDGWRRKKPEYWHVRKGYSPVVIDQEPLPHPLDAGSKGGIAVEICNRFNHTNLNELSVEWQLADQHGVISGPNAIPGQRETLLVPAEFICGDTLNLKFVDPFGFCVDERAFLLGGKTSNVPALSGSAPNLVRKTEEILVTGQDFQLVFSAETGLIKAGYYENHLIITDGPCLHLTGLDLEPWKLKHMDAQSKHNCVQINLQGNYGSVEVHFTICIDAQGLMEVSYTITNMPYSSPRKVAITSSILSHSGGYSEVGVSFTLAESLDKLKWKRRGLWDVYPDWHIGRLDGETSKFNEGGVNPPDCPPEWEWKQDEREWALLGTNEMGRRGTRDFYSMKAYIECASLHNGQIGFSAYSDYSDSVRMERMIDAGHLISDRSPLITYHGSRLKRENRFHSFDGTETWLQEKGAYCELAFDGTGIVWYSSLDRICGKADVFIDGALAYKELDLGCSRISKDPRGYQKNWRYPAFVAENLLDGRHTIRIVATGKEGVNCCNSYVNIDSFLILDGTEMDGTQFIINSEFNYPEISWACYSKPPIQVKTGYQNKIYVRMDAV